MAEEDIIIIDEDIEEIIIDEYIEEIIIDEDIEEIIIDEDIEEIIIDDDDDDNLEIDNLDDSYEDGLEEESEEEIPPLVDSDYASDNDDELREKKCRYLNEIEINNLDVTIKMCCITYYYYDVDERTRYCSDCFIRLAYSFRRADSIRKHKTDYSALLIGSYCKECRKSLHLMIPCNMCPICTN